MAKENVHWPPREGGQCTRQVVTDRGGGFNLPTHGQILTVRNCRELESSCASGIGLSQSIVNPSAPTQISQERRYINLADLDRPKPIDQAAGL
jgi:hypothetical protein